MSPQKRKVHGEHDSDIEASPPWNAGPGKGGRTAVTGDPLSNWFERHFTVLENQGGCSTTSCYRPLCRVICGEPSRVTTTGTHPPLRALEAICPQRTQYVTA